jgi:hypothetical protein
MVGRALAEVNTRPGDAGVRSGFLLALFAVGLAWRALVAALTPLPSEDGASYLWMAERFAAGEPAQALDEVFPPLTSLLIAGPVALGV